MSNALVARAKRLVRKIIPSDTQRQHILAARSAYRGIIANPGVNELSSATRRTIRQYANDVLGRELYMPWLEMYTAYRGEFLEGWIPDNYFEWRVLPQINAPYRELGMSKTLSRRLLDTELLPDIAYRLNGNWFDLNSEPIQVSALKRHLFEVEPVVYVKLERSSRGRGVFILHRDNFSLEALPTSGNCVVQRGVRQAKWFDPISPNATATLRVTTALDDRGVVKFTASFLRTGVGEKNFITSGTSLKFVVIDGDGSLSSFASDSVWKRHTRHPDTGASFENLRIPGYRAAVDACVRLHAKVPHLGIIGWDLAIDDNGESALLEWNTSHPGIKFQEAAVGPTLREFNYERFARNTR